MTAGASVSVRGVRLPVGYEGVRHNLKSFGSRWFLFLYLGGFHMAQIDVSELTFGYEGSFDTIFEQVSFSVDTDWRLGLIGRNGKGKTTFLNLLLGMYEYQGSIRADTVFEYFPWKLLPEDFEECGAVLAERMKADCEMWRVIRELDKLQVDPEALYRPFETLSQGERTKVMLAVLFSGGHEFLLIDEPANHLDQACRETVKNYLARKRGFILVSHDRALLDGCIDHVLVLNRCSIEVQKGNFSSWWENKRRKDAFSQMENEKHRKEIHKLRQASRRAGQWAERNESTKIGYDPVAEPDHANRAFIGMKTKKMQSRVKQMEGRIEREIAAKEGLLQDVETVTQLKLFPVRHAKQVLLRVHDYSLGYGSREEENEKFLFRDLRFTVEQGERIFLNGKNGCGKSSLIRAILNHASADGGSGAAMDGMTEQGTLETASGLVISYINQDTGFLQGSIRSFCEERGLEESLFCALLRQLDLERAQFAKPVETFSEGQKKKILLAASLLTPAHLYIWDEPLNYIAVLSRMQIEEVITMCNPTMLIVEHDSQFREKIATKVVDL